MLVKLILENYIPLLSSGITKIELDTRSMINLFIAPNGVGKTSCLKELNPLPPENGNYRGGRKYVEYIHNKRTYKLDSYTGVGNGHSFKIDDGPELNTGGTYSAQKELVYNHFGKADGGLIRILNGLKMVDRLSAMSPNRRKEVILQVYPNDTEYALGVYSKLRQERNDLKSTIKKQIERHTEENRKLSTLSNCGVEELERRIKQVDQDLQSSLLMRGRLESAKMDPNLRSKHDRYTFLVDKLLVNNLSGVQFSKEELESAYDTADGMLSKYQDKANVLKGVIAEHASYLEGLDDFLKDPGAFKDQAKHIDEDLARTNKDLERYNNLLNNQPVFDDPEMVFTGLEYVVGRFKEYLGRVVTLSDESLTSGAYKQLLLDQEQLGNKLRNLKSQLEQMEHKLRHYQSAENIECPDCTSTFKVGITQKDIATLQETIAAQYGQVERLTAQSKALDLRIENDAEWYLTMNQLYNFVRENGNVRVLPELIRSYNIGKSPAGPLCNVLDAFMCRVGVIAYRQTLFDEKKVVDARLDLISQDNVLDIATHVQNLETDLVGVNNQISFYKRRVFLLNEELMSIANYEREIEEVRLLQVELLEGMANRANVQLRDLVDTRVSELTGMKDEHMSSIINAKSLTAVVESITSDINRMRARLKTVEILMDGLCPSKGIIGKLMSDFINSLCGNVNTVIKEIWNTTLYVKPCNKENGDLNYKFPVVTGDADPTPDISECSAGETDMIDWAFRFVLAAYVGFPTPLIMDEVGVSFDEIKRGRFFNFIQEYTQGKNPRQLFMVSHYFGQYGILKDPNIIAFKYEGLTLPGTPNKHSVVV
jgi:hypothetical protein